MSRLKNYRTFGGKRYGFQGIYPTKGKATQRARSYRNEGIAARVVRDTFSGKWAVWVKR